MVEVAAVILREQNGKILICRRGAGGNCAYLWEFPGGKREPGESLEDCAVRECREELGVEIALEGVYDTHSFCYPDKEIAFTFFVGTIQSGIPTLYVHSGLCWVTCEELDQFSFCPADKELIARLMQDNL